MPNYALHVGDCVFILDEPDVTGVIVQETKRFKPGPHSLFKIQRRGGRPDSTLYGLQDLAKTGSLRIKQVLICTHREGQIVGPCPLTKAKRGHFPGYCFGFTGDPCEYLKWIAPEVIRRSFVESKALESSLNQEYVLCR